MKLLSKEEEDAHYAVVVKYGSVGAALGLAGSSAAMVLASRRWAGVKNLTLAMKGFLITSASGAASVIAGDRGSQVYSNQHQSQKSFYNDRQAQLRHKEVAEMSSLERLADWGRRERYKILGFTWVASMIGSWYFVGRNPYLTKQQKIVQARVYAQGLTLAVLCGTAGFEMHDRRQNRSGILDAVQAKNAQKKEHTRPDDKGHARTDDKGEDLWKDMVAAEEKRLEEKGK